MDNKIYISQQGYEKLFQDLELLRNVKRREISKRIADARALGDISENAEYDAAKEAQVHLEERIKELEDKLARAIILEEKDISLEKVRIGVKVDLQDTENDEELVYIITSDEEANYDENKIGISSPIAQALLGKKKGEKVEIKVPAGILRYRIVSINLP